MGRDQRPTECMSISHLATSESSYLQGEVHINDPVGSGNLFTLELHMRNIVSELFPQLIWSGSIQSSFLAAYLSFCNVICNERASASD